MSILNSVIDVMASEEVKVSYEEIRKESIYYSNLFEKNNHLNEYKEYVNQSYIISNKTE